MRISKLVVALSFLILPLSCFASDLFLGNWTLDVKKSKYAGGQIPKAMTIRMTDSDSGKGIHYRSLTFWQNGAASSADYTAAYDGQPSVVSGGHGMLLPVSLRKSSATEVVATYSSGLETIATSRRVLSKDGNMMTMITTSRDKSGKSFTNVGVYRRTENIPESVLEPSVRRPH